MPEVSEIQTHFFELFPQVQHFGILLLKALIIMLVGYYVSKFIRSKVHKAIAKKDHILANFISQIIFILSIVVMILAALGTIGVQTNSIIAVLGTAGVAIALGLKDSLSSVASGIILIILRPFKQGDLIEFDGMIGSVEVINLFTTHLRLNDGKFAIIPNSNIAKANIVNTTYNEQRRIELILGVGYESDIDLVKNLVIKVFNSCPEVDLTQGYFVGLTELGESSLNFTLRFWVKLEYGVINAQSKVLEAIKKILDENHIEIPYNKLDVNIIKQDAS